MVPFKVGNYQKYIKLKFKHQRAVHSSPQFCTKKYVFYVVKIKKFIILS